MKDTQKATQKSIYKDFRKQSKINLPVVPFKTQQEDHRKGNENDKYI